MSQISPPIRILGLCAIGLIAAWFAFLKPGDPAPVPAATTPPATTTPNVAAGGAPATTGVGSVTEAANTLKANADAKTGGAAPADAAAAAPAATVADPASPALTGGKVDKAAAQSGMPLRVLKAIADRKVMALYFWNPKAADDRAVDAELRRAAKGRKNLFVHRATLSEIARYGQITRGVDVKQSPTLVVVDRKLQAEALVGYTDRAMIEQAVDDAQRVKK
jgi:hypothetical protein